MENAVNNIVPRWEWRTFGASLEQGASAIRKYDETRVKQSTEQYIVSRRGSDNVKIRDGLIDIKTLLDTNDDGLEQWTVRLER
jgi:exopolyphosphatase/guanosine-5'-triphosphate,3'-diphosphate pyrophosphatase